MRILVISDTHRKLDNLEYVLEHVGRMDLLIHLGDVEGQEMVIQGMVHCPVYTVAGNNDYFSNLPKDVEVTIEGKKLFLTHGHQYLINQGTMWIKEEAMARGADLVLYGHTHKPMIQEEDHLMILSPGSLSYPRQSGRKPSYLIIKTDNKGNFQYQIEYVS